ncbi:MAG: phosphonate C-P lyase system protein PhnG [Stenomitos rutilans HA7619-LM2]|jgi:alpha-D-ribose 1-methylphosphonate 5-triphosphate synthase subunit PhnG|nr:phosphonate C-P lyase system protein PhnG [Stenomitos rutilans HA7619-LM2]
MIPQSQWVRALTAHPSQTIQSLAEQLTFNWQVNYKALPQAGLSLLQMADGVFHEPYYLGEIPLACAWIELTNSAQESFEGAAQVMDDSAELAVALAVCDAVMTHQLSGWQKVAELIQQGMEKRTWEDQQRGLMLAKTRVNFALLSEDEERRMENGE